MRTFYFAAAALFLFIGLLGPHNWPVYIVCGVAWIAVGLSHNE